MEGRPMRRLGSPLAITLLLPDFSNWAMRSPNCATGACTSSTSSASSLLPVTVSFQLLRLFQSVLERILTRTGGSLERRCFCSSGPTRHTR